MPTSSSDALHPVHSELVGPERLTTHGVSPASGDPAGDRFVFAMGDRIIVVNTSTPAVYAHRVNGNVVEEPVRLTVHGQSPASGDPTNDRFAFAFDQRIWVINTATRDAWVHVVDGDIVREPVCQTKVDVPADAKFLVPVCWHIKVGLLFKREYAFHELFALNPENPSCAHFNILSPSTSGYCASSSQTLEQLPPEADPAGFTFAFAMGWHRILIVNPRTPGVYGYPIVTADGW